MRFSRKGRASAAGPDDALDSAPDEGVPATPADDPGAEVGEQAQSALRGPWDVSDDHGVPLDETVDLGSLRVAPLDGLDIRLQVDETSGDVAALLLADEEGAVELRAFAAPRSGGLWEEIRPAIVAEIERMGGQAQPFDGPLGVELRTVLPLSGPDGEQVVQPSRVFAIEGPRWMVRATLLGRPAVETDQADRWLAALERVLVVRGETAMAPGDTLVLTMPPGVEPIVEDGLDEGGPEVEQEGDRP